MKPCLHVPPDTKCESGASGIETRLCQARPKNMNATEDHTVGRVARVFFSAACVSADFLYLTRDDHRGPKKTLRDPGTASSYPTREQRDERMTACQQLAPEVGIAAACRSMEVSRATFYRRLFQAERPEVDTEPRPKPVRALSDEERGKVVEMLHQERFM